MTGSVGVYHRRLQARPRQAAGLDSAFNRSTDVVKRIHRALPRLSVAADHAQLPQFSIEIGALDPQRLGGVSHTAVMLADHRGDVVALEAEPRLPEARAADGRDLTAVEPHLREQILETD